METEASLSEPVLARRRSSSFSDDYSVQKTNDDASQSKLAAVQLKYWEDPYLRHFVSAVTELHRDPEISIGYWARVTLIWQVVNDFLQKSGNDAQIISLGAGFDTLYWRLKSSGAKFSRFVEVDFSSVTSKKIRLIRKPGSSDLTSAFNEPIKESQHADLHAGDYHLVGADIRQWAELQGKLESTGMDMQKPTIVLAECVLVYMAVSQSTELLSQLVKSFKSLALLSYEQVNTDDQFGRVMVANLEKRGLKLPGLETSGSIEKQRQRLMTAGFTHGWIVDLHEAYGRMLDEREKKRVEQIEMLDEKELLTQLNEHYSLTYVVNGEGEKLSLNELAL